jgi:hypothetical protein
MELAMDDSPFRTVQLCDEERQVEVEFVPEAGMLCRSLRHRGQSTQCWQRTSSEAEPHGDKLEMFTMSYSTGSKLADISRCYPAFVAR